MKSQITFKKGKSRLVFIIGPLVFKFPRIHLIHFIFTCLNDLFHLRKPFYWNFIFFKRAIIPGLTENLNEARNYYRFKSSLLARLYLPLIIVNVYKRKKGIGNFSFLNGKFDNLVIQTENDDFIQNYSNIAHTFENADNFSFDGRNIKIIDYGEIGFDYILANYEQEIKTFLLNCAIKPKN